MLDMKVEVRVADLIKHLEANKKAHQDEFQTATAKYFQTLRDTISQMADDCDLGRIRSDNYTIHLPVPRDESAKYDKYINMLGMTRTTLVSIGSDEHDKFVEDNWDWAIASKMLNSRYLG